MRRGEEWDVIGRKKYDYKAISGWDAREDDVWQFWGILETVACDQRYIKKKYLEESTAKIYGKGGKGKKKATYEV